MLVKLAFRNILAKPARAIAIVIAIAAAIAMIFAMLSFKPAVRDYIFSTEAAISGDFDVKISTSSRSDRLTATSALVDANGAPKLEGIERVVPSLKLFATVGDDYVQVRGFSYGTNAAADIQVMQKIRLYAGSLDGMRPDDVVISRAAAKFFGVDAGDGLTLGLGGRKTTVYIKGIAEDDGYFLSDSPYLVLGFSRALSELIVPGVELCNEIFVKAAAGYDADELIKSIKAIPDYSSLLVSRAVDEGRVEEQTSSLTAPIVLAGAAVMTLSVFVIALLFLMSEKEKLSLISRMSIIGASKGQILLVFAIEGLMFAAVGALLGAGLAVGVFVGILKLTLSASANFAISVWRLFAAEAIGFVAAAASSFLPVARAFKGTIRANMAAGENRSPAFIALAALAANAAVCLLVILLALDAMSATTYAAVGIALLVALVATLALGMPYVVQGVGKLLSKSKAPAIRIASYRLARDRRASRTASALGVGMAISMLLFMAWALTTSIFTAYISDFENMAIATNIQADVDIAEFESVEGVDRAVKLVWQQGKLSSDKLERSVRILGSERALDLVDFKYVSDESVVRQRLAGDGDYVFVDEAFCKLYGIRDGDVLNLSLDGATHPVTVGGTLSHRLFNGAYIVVGERTLERLFGLKADAVIICMSGDKSAAIGRLEAKFSSKNYYVIEALEAFKWDMRSAQSVFDLIGTLAFVVAVFILAAAVANSIVGRAGEEKSRRALLCAGMSENMLFASEFAEHGFIACLSYIAAFAFCAPMTAGLIAALNLFGLSFEFMFEAWVVAAVGAAMSVAYALVPLIFNFKRGYSLKK